MVSAFCATRAPFTTSRQKRLPDVGCEEQGANMQIEGACVDAHGAVRRKSRQPLQKHRHLGNLRSVGPELRKQRRELGQVRDLLGFQQDLTEKFRKRLQEGLQMVIVVV